MLSTSYVVLVNREGWTVYQDGEPVSVRADKADAADMAHRLALGAASEGVSARLYVQDEAGELQNWALDTGSKLLARLLASRRSSTADA
jgi:hypothetical protein